MLYFTCNSCHLHSLLYTTQYTFPVIFVQFTVHTLHSLLYNTPFTPFIPYCTIHRAHPSFLTVHYTVHILHSLLYTTQYTLYSFLYTIQTVHTLHFYLYTSFILYILSSKVPGLSWVVENPKLLFKI